jgi:hypothetical protein
MQKFCLVFCIMLILLATVTICYADERGRGHGDRHGRGDWHGHGGGWGLFIGPAPVYPYYPYDPYYPECERVCRDRVIRVCDYDYWGDRWCHDEVVRECRRECY